MKWAPHIYDMCLRTLQAKPQRMHAANRSEDSQAMAIDMVWELVVYDFLPSEARRMFAFTHKRIPVAWSVKQIMDRGIALSDWVEFLERKLPIGDVTPVPSFEQWVFGECAEGIRNAPRHRWGLRYAKHDEILSDLNPWNRTFPARFGILKRPRPHTRPMRTVPEARPEQFF